jgi:predicted ester cyclase
MPTETTRALARRFFTEQDRLRGGPAEELCAPGYTAHLAGGPPLDYSGHRVFAAAFYAAFPDLRHHVELVAAQEDQAAVRFILQGTHTGDFMGMPPTGRPIRITATAIMHLTGEQITELWGEFDQVGLMGQLSGHAVPADPVQSPGI